MVATFYDWNAERGYHVPDRAVLHANYREYQLIMMALKTYAVENDIYSEVAEIIQLVSDIETFYKIARDLVASEES